MRVRVKFHKYDDVSQEARDRIEGGILTINECTTVFWYRVNGSWCLRFSTDRNATEIIEAFEYDGFAIEEFQEFSFLPN